MLETDEKTKLIKMLNGYRRPRQVFFGKLQSVCVLRAGGPGGLPNQWPARAHYQGSH
jgi:hypothetical protein